MNNVLYNENGYVVEGGDVQKLCLAYRPGHTSCEPQVFAETLGQKIISHNYGHAGLGYCLGFGTSRRAVDNMLEKCGELKKDEEIAIIGAGVIGMLTALELHKRGFTNIKLFSKDDDMNGTASMRAGALIFICFNEISKDEEAR